MAIAPPLPPAIETLADLVDRLGGVPLTRIRFHPYPGTATVQDVIDASRRNGKRCELVAGVLVEKPMGWNESSLAGWLVAMLNIFVLPRNLGIVTIPDGAVELREDLVRLPDVAFTRWDRLPDRKRPTRPIPNIAPNLAVEVLSRSNTPREMAIKRQDYFAAGVELVWEIDLEQRSVVVFTSPADSETLRAGDALTGGAVLPEFTLAVADLFAELDRQE